MSNITPWKELNRQPVFRKFSRAIEVVTFLLPNRDQADFYIKAERPTASILGLTPHHSIILVKQYRPGPKEILLELPGGFIDPREHPNNTAQREFLEETGYTGDFHLVGTCLDDAYSTMVRYCYVATNCHPVAKIQATAIEQTEVVELSIADFRQHLRSGQMTDVEVGYLGLDYLGLL